MDELKSELKDSSGFIVLLSNQNIDSFFLLQKLGAAITIVKSMLIVSYTPVWSSKFPYYKYSVMDMTGLKQTEMNEKISRMFA